MILPDVNVLIYAFRVDSADHLKYRTWLSDLVNGVAAYGMAPQVLSSVIRICTHPRIYMQPSSLENVLAFCNVLLEAPNATLITPQERHWSIFQKLCARSKAIGNLVPDAWLAALAIEAGCEWITTDRDFARFEGLTWRPPF
ncbi:MAG TPA: type II toxin-antitoxin system VapC family toxin [Steroidobacteraceae bacterium]|nr:type II toxin-antitoxin system VapC family toxin [Steroidobacteraceae bacterium]